MQKKRPSKGSDLDGRVWTFSTTEAAREVYTTVLQQSSFLSDKHDCSLQTGFFEGQPFLVFLWASNVEGALVATVKHYVLRGGGKPFAQELQEELLRQARLRWRVMRKPEGGTVIKHHPRARRWTDLRD